MTPKEKIFNSLDEFKLAYLEKNYGKATIIALDLAILTKELRDQKK